MMQMLEQYKIYYLSDPVTLEIRYVGKTKSSLKRRLGAHIRAARKGLPKTGKADWILGILKMGYKPRIDTLETCSPHDWKWREEYWINTLGKHGKLLNKNKAGGGGDGRGLDNDGLNKIFEFLGKLSDSEVAEKVGVTRKTISYYREKFGIKASNNRKRNVPPPYMAGHNVINLSDKQASLLGTLPDHILADAFGCSKKAVASARKRRGIKSYAETTGNNGRIKKNEPHRRWKK